jgi:hypothetical protein
MHHLQEVLLSNQSYIPFKVQSISTYTQNVKKHCKHGFSLRQIDMLIEKDMEVDHHALLRVIFCVVLRRVVFNSRRFGTLCLFLLHRQVDMKCVK